MPEQDLIPRLFRTEYRKIVSVLCKYLGIENISIAEDLAGETFLTALESWPYNGIPENPEAWLYTVAKNKTRNYIARSKLFNEKVIPVLEENQPDPSITDLDLSGKNITDSQLKMLFVICHPTIPTEAQIGLSLRILCGFGIEEIASALLTNKETINKRLYRAKEKLRTEKVKIELPSENEINERLTTVLTTLYLLFNEGYYSDNNASVLSKDLCLEAMRLTHLLTENTLTNTPEVNALFALMCFHSSRFEARENNNGEIILYDDQDESLWNQELITKGAYYLNLASTGSYISKFHLEANIAYWHTLKADSEEKWENILGLYNELLIMEYSPVAALNRTYALSKVKGKRIAIEEAEKLKLVKNYSWHLLLGKLYQDLDNNKALVNFKKALSLVKMPTIRQVIQRNIDSLPGSPSKQT
jgi:RNA polymerase sigma factor (sigma-70 family)